MFCKTLRKPARLSVQCVALSLLFVSSFLAQTPKPPTTLSSEKRQQIEQAAQQFLSKTSTPGISVAVVLDGKPVWSAGFGKADLENSVPATSETLFRLASVSKPITATAVLQLSERGKLDLDAEVQKYCPAFPKKQWPVTTRELLGHLGGIRHYNLDGKGDIPEDSAKHFSSMEESLQIFANDPLVVQPGTKFNYSTYGYTLLGCVLEGAASQKYLDYVRANIFAPTAMNQTQADDFFAVIPLRSRWYHKKDESSPVQNAGVLDSSYKIPGGGFVSSADDMARFESAILNDRLLKHATRELMWTSQKTTDDKETNYGMGWGVMKKFNLTLYNHTGGQQGTSTVIIVIPERQAGIVVLANLDNIPAMDLSLQILKIVFDLKD